MSIRLNLNLAVAQSGQLLDYDYTYTLQGKYCQAWPTNEAWPNKGNTDIVPSFSSIWAIRRMNWLVGTSNRNCLQNESITLLSIDFASNY